MRNDFKETIERMKGVLAPIMPAFHDDGSLDLTSTCRWIDWMIKGGIKNFWTTFGTSHYFSLTDKEVYTLTKAVGEIINSRAIFIAAAPNHWPVYEIKSFISYAEKSGANVVKIMPDNRFDAKNTRAIEFHKAIAKDSPLPLLSYTLGIPTAMSVDLLKEIIAIDEFIGMKNDSGDFYVNCKYLRVARENDPSFMIITGGTTSSYMHGVKFGQTFYADVMAMFNPKKAIECMNYINSGDFSAATEIIKLYEEPIIKLSEVLPGSHWSAYHSILKVKGLFESNYVRYPLQNASCDIDFLSKYIPIEGLKKVKKV